jgi:hypothetical protein
LPASAPESLAIAVGELGPVLSDAAGLRSAGDAAEHAQQRHEDAGSSWLVERRAPPPVYTAHPSQMLFYAERRGATGELMLATPFETKKVSPIQ